MANSLHPTKCSPATWRARSRIPLAGLALAALAAGCGTAALAPSVIDYREAKVLRLHGFTEDKVTAPEQGQSIVYNLKHEEGRRMARMAARQGQEPPLTYTLAHNVAKRLRDASSPYEDAGRALPMVIASSAKNPRGWLATGSGSGAAFAEAPKTLPEPAAEVTGTLEKGPSGWHATLVVREAGLPARSFDFDPIDERVADASGLSLPQSPRAELIAAMADFLAPHQTPLSTAALPLVVGRAIDESGRLQCDGGTWRRAFTVTEVVEAFDPPLATPPSAADLEELLVGRYVRLVPPGAAVPPEHPRVIRVRVAEAIRTE